jgi:hypothetical protein
MKQYFLLFFLLLSGFVFAQPLLVNVSYITSVPDKSKSLVFYSPGEQLSIADFESRPDKGSDAVAITSSGFAFSAGFRNVGGKATLQITVHCSFDRSKSWMKEAGKNGYILGHEQLHFDISYIAAMRFAGKLKVASFTTGNYAKLLEKKYSESVAELEAMQHRYDAETQNGQVPEKQQEWALKIKAQVLTLASEQ